MSKKKTALPDDIDSIFNKSAFFDGNEESENTDIKEDNQHRQSKVEKKIDNNKTERANVQENG